MTTSVALVSDGLLLSLKAGDPEAQARGRASLYPEILTVCRRLLGDDITAEQVASDIWTDFTIDCVGRVRSAAAVPKYLRMMAVRRCLRFRAAQAKHCEVTEDLVTNDDPEHQVIEMIDGQRWRARLRECMRGIRPRTRGVLRMRFHHEMTLEAIGKAVGVSKQAVQQNLAAALAELRRCVERQS